MKRTLLLTFFLGALSLAANAAAVQFTTQFATFSESGSGSTLNQADNNDTLDLSSTAFDLFSHNTGAGGLANGLNIVSGITNYEFFKLGTISLDDTSIDGSETNNLGPFNITFGLNVAGAVRTYSISSESWTASAGQDSTTIGFPGHPGQTLTFSNGAVVEAVIYAGNTIASGNDITLDSQGPTSHDVYVKLGLITAPTTSPVPEPGSMALLGSGLLGLGMIARRRTTKK